MALPISLVHRSPEEYLRLERAADYKSQYVDGQIYAMSGGSLAHSSILVNLAREISSQLRGGRCQAFSSETKVRTPSDNLYTYPDLTVVCGNPLTRDDNTDVLENPVLIIEVLSPTTEAFDRGKKFARYQEIVSLADYVLVSQDEPRVEHYVRQPNDSWNVTAVTGLNSNIVFPSIGCTLELTAIYERVRFNLPTSE